jgi:hypothetical protein
MQFESIRYLIREKLADGRLPQESLAKVWGGEGLGEMCLACDTPVKSNEFVVKGIGANEKAVQFHVRCLYYWHSEVARAA